MQARSPHPSGLRQGSTLVFATVAILALGIIVFSMLDWTRSEVKVIQTNQAALMAQNNANSLLEFGIAQVSSRLNSKTELSYNEFVLHPITQAPDTIFESSSQSQLISSQLDVGPIMPSVSRYIDPSDPSNAYDPDKGKTVLVRPIVLTAKVVQSGPLDSQIQAASSMVFELREKPLFNNTIFTNSDLILLRPAQPMVISGPVATNGNLILVSEGGIYFNGVVTVAGNIQTPTLTGDVFFRSGGTDANPTYAPFNSYSGSGWKNYALSVWNGYVQTQEMGIKPQKPFGFEGISSADPNPYYAIIQPPKAASDPSVNPSIEAAKLSTQADLVITISVQKTYPSYGIPGPGTDLNNMLAPVPSGSKSITNSSNAYNLGSFVPWPSLAELRLASASTTPAMPYGSINPQAACISYRAALQPKLEGASFDNTNVTTVKAYRYIPSSSGPYYRRLPGGGIGRFERQEVSIPALYNAAYPADPKAIIRSQCGTIDYNEVYNFYLQYFQNVYPVYSERVSAAENQFGADRHSFNHINTPWITPKPKPNVANNPAIIMWDARRRQWLHMTDIDIGLLKQALDTGKIPSWNGIVYVECSDLDGTGLRLLNANQVPSQGQQGFTLATNNALYVQGHFNADGNFNTGSSQAHDKAQELPAALMADAVTVLSNHWDDRLSRCDVAPFSTIANNISSRNPPQETEIAAAIVSGSDVFNSGGINNFVRLLEMWQGKRLRIRGSLVSLYSSEVAYEPFCVNYVYFPPIREFGFSDVFKNNRFPPGMPWLRNVQKIQKRNIGSAEYEEVLSLMRTALQASQFDSQLYWDRLKAIQAKYNLNPYAEASLVRTEDWVSSAPVPSPAPTPTPGTPPSPTPSPSTPPPSAPTPPSGGNPNKGRN